MSCLLNLRNTVLRSASLPERFLLRQNRLSPDLESLPVLNMDCLEMFRRSPLAYGLIYDSLYG